MAVLPDAADVLEQHLGTALGPAQALLPQTTQGFRHEDPAQRARLVKDAPVIELQLPADVDVFGDHVRAPVADPVQRGTAEGDDHPGHGEDPPEHPLRALDQADDRGDSPTCTRPTNVERVRIRGLPVTAPRRALSSIGATR